MSFRLIDRARLKIRTERDAERIALAAARILNRLVKAKKGKSDGAR